MINERIKLLTLRKVCNSVDTPRSTQSGSTVELILKSTFSTPHRARVFGPLSQSEPSRVQLMYQEHQAKIPATHHLASKWNQTPKINPEGNEVPVIGNHLRHKQCQHF